MIPPLPVIFVFPVVALILFTMLNQRTALIWTILLGYLFLPEKTTFNLPVLPSLSKHTMPVMSVILCLLLFGASRKKAGVEKPPLPGLLPRNPLVLSMIALVLFGGFLTVLTNLDPQRFGDTVLQALRVYDGFSSTLSSLMVLLPLLLARKYLSSEADHRLLLVSLTLAGALYSLPIIFELVMSPQLHNIVYGFRPSGWNMVFRGDGWRPIVFLKQGLLLGIFMCCAMLAAFAYARVFGLLRAWLWTLLAVYLLVILVAVKAFGAMMIGLMILPGVLLFGARMQLLMAGVIAAALLTYPMLRGAGLVPVEQVANLAERVDPNRANSLRARLMHEDTLLERANQRPAFGWGGWNRARVFDDLGRNQSVTDGYWVTRIGEKGWVGYFGTFGLLCLPTILMALRRKKYQVSLATSGLCLVLIANLIDLIPNATLTPVTWLIAGALAGRLERQSEAEDDPATKPADQPARKRQYSRFDPVRTRPRPNAS